MSYGLLVVSGALDVYTTTSIRQLINSSLISGLGAEATCCVHAQQVVMQLAAVQVCSTHIWLTIVIVGHLLYLAFFFLLHITQAVVRSHRKSSCSFG